MAKRMISILSIFGIFHTGGLGLALAWKHPKPQWKGVSQALLRLRVLWLCFCCSVAGSVPNPVQGINLCLDEEQREQRNQAGEIRRGTFLPPRYFINPVFGLLLLPKPFIHMRHMAPQEKCILYFGKRDKHKISINNFAS